MLISQKRFALLIGVSPACIWYYRNIGILCTFNTRILLRESLKAYLDCYLPTHIRHAAIINILDRLKVQIMSTNNPLLAARAANINFNSAYSKARILKDIARFADMDLTADIAAAQNQIATLKAACITSKTSVTNFIQRLHFDALTESILIYRYVDLMKWHEISEITHYSESRLYQLHRAAMSIIRRAEFTPDISG